MEMIAVFLNRMLTVFLALVRPLSSAAKPRCMMNTRKVATSIQVLFTVNISWETSSLREHHARHQYEAQEQERVATDPPRQRIRHW